MAITTKTAKKFSKYIHAQENIFATIENESGRFQHRACITEGRVHFLLKEGTLKWTYDAFGFDDITNISVSETALRATVWFSFKDGEDAKLPKCNKKDAREFSAAFSFCRDQDPALISQRTKVCPECDELVKYRAHRCKHCGYQFK